MLITKFVIIVVILVHGRLSCLIGQNNQCFCNVDRLLISCTGLEESIDEVLPSAIPVATRYLTLRKNWVLDSLTLREVHLSKLSRLVRFDISRNRIDKIEAGVFSDFNWLEEVDLSRNKLRVLENDVFSGSLPRLRTIDLSNNKLLVLLGETFSAAGNLINLDLRNNPVVFIAPRSFQGLGLLESLTMSDFQVSDFPNQALSALGSLQRLEMKNFRFVTQVPDFAFSNNHVLTTLVISDFPKLSENGWATHSLWNLTKLRNLTARACNLASIPNDSLRPVRSLRTLDVSNNPIRVVRTNDLFNVPNLKELNLASTALNNIEVGAFANLGSLKFINLANNRLNTVARAAFPVDTSALSTIRMTNNVWECDCRLSWIVTSLINIANDIVTCTMPPIYQGSNLVTSVQRIAQLNGCLPSKIINSHPSNVTDADVDTSVELPCFATGNPQPTVTWYRPTGTVISDITSNTERIRHNVIENRLIIRDVTTDDVGDYRCVATNGVGIDERVMKLRVLNYDGTIVEQVTSTGNWNSSTMILAAMTQQPPIVKCKKNSPIAVTVLIGVMSALAVLGLLLSFLLGVWGYNNDKQIENLKKRLRNSSKSDKPPAPAPVKPQLSQKLPEPTHPNNDAQCKIANTGYSSPRNFPAVSNYRMPPSPLPQRPPRIGSAGIERKVNFRTSISSGYGSFGNGNLTGKFEGRNGDAVNS